MSLDIYLRQERPVGRPSGSGIFVRENGNTKEITRAEWDERNPGREPVTFQSDEEETNETFSANITHNLTTMAKAAGIYQCLWNPEELAITEASELIDPLTKGLDVLRSDPERFKAFNPTNGWGDYEGFVEFVESYLVACKEHPNDTIHIWK